VGVNPHSGLGEDGGRALRTYLLCILAAFAIIVLRLAFLQLIQHSAHRKTSLDNVLRTDAIPPPRGTIYDRSGRVLAISKQTYGLLFIPPPDLGLHMPDDELRRLLKVTGRHYHYLRNQGDNPNPRKRKAHERGEPPRLWEILEKSRPPELMAAAARLEAQLPTKDAVKQQVQTVWPNPASLGESADAWNFSAPAAYAEYLQFRGTLRSYLNGRGNLLAEYDNDSRTLLQSHLAKLLSDHPETASSQLADGIAATLRDSVLLGLYYVDCCALATANPRYLRLKRIVGLASYFAATKPETDKARALLVSMTPTVAKEEAEDNSYEALMARLESEKTRSYVHEPLKVVDELLPHQRLYIAEHNQQFSNFIIEQYSFRRLYTFGPGTAHLLGYTGAPSEEQVGTKDKPKGLGYDPHERSGKAGIESQYETLLRGNLGERHIEINRQGAYQKVVELEAPRRGTDLYLSIDAGLQAKANALLGGERGAIIVSSLQPENPGEILALASSPTYDATRLREAAYYAKLRTNPLLPELNRAVGQAFPPGSTFKLVTLAAALHSGTTELNNGFYCPGFMDIGNVRIAPQRRFRCHKHDGHHGVGVTEALAESCDVAFYTMGLRLEKAGDPSVLLHDYAIDFGYGSITGIDLPGEVKGTVPDRSWKREAMSKWASFMHLRPREEDLRWYDGDTLNYSIGQGFLQVTPLQVLWSANTVAWDGVRYPPHLLIARSTAHGQQREEPPVAQGTELDLAVLGHVKQAMKEAVNYGTCESLRAGKLAALDVCAKTGTAETRKGHLDHSWVVGFFPRESPRYGFVCFFEYGGHAGDAAVPAAKLLLEWIQKNDPLGRSQLSAPSA
jgi:penicillin-binding protein 2